MSGDWAGGVEIVSAGQLAVGDVVTIRNGPRRCTVQVIRNLVPGVVWLYLIDPDTGERIRGHVALPISQEVLRH